MNSPIVDPQFDRMNGLQRTAETFGYVLLSFEFFMSPEGNIRNWVKANARLAVFMAAPTFMVFPVVTMALWELSSCVNALNSITGHLIFLPILTLLALASISICCRLLRR